MSNATLPKISDIFSDTEFQWSRIFTEAWIQVFGLWFFAMVLGVIGGAIYMKFENTMVTLIYFLLVGIILSSILSAGVLYVLGLMIAFGIGFLLYNVFIKKE